MSLPCDWQTSKQKLSEYGQHLLETGQCSDCNFIVGQEPQQQTFKNHKLFLAMSSPIFKTMFFGDMAETNDPILIRDVQPEAFKALLEYMYTDKVELDSFELAYDLYYCAKKYMLLSLVEKCTEYMWRNISPKEACCTYEFAKLFEEPVLMDRCLQMIRIKTDEVLKEASWEDVQLGTLLKVLEQDDLQISSEIELFTALERWSKSECLRKSLDFPTSGKSVIGNALSKINFLSLTLREFTKGPGMSPLLTKDEIVAIMMNILPGDNKTPMPEGFCTQRFSRARSIKITHSMSMELPGDGESSSSTMRNISQRLVEVSLTNPGNLLTSSRGIVMHNGPKYYCTRFISRTNCHNSDVLRHSVKFSVDKNICMMGIQVPTQNNTFTSQLFIKIFKEMMEYCENIYVQLLDCNGTELTCTHLTDTYVRSDTLVDLIFVRPVHIQKHEVYQIVVKFAKDGYYSVGAGRRDKERCGSVTFTFDRDNSSCESYDGFIRSIIFTCH